MKLRPFELALFVTFGLLMVGALILLRTVEPKNDTDEVPFGSVVIWGTLPGGPMSSLLSSLGDSDENYRNVSYQYLPPEDLPTRLIEAIADGESPDLLLISQEEMVPILNRVQNIPYTAKSLAEYRSQYVDGAEIFLNTEGFFGYPVAVNPLMLYWNRDLFSANGIIGAPVTWEEMVIDTIPSLVRVGNAAEITQPAIALGEHQNISHYLPILSTLLLQAGSPMVVRDERGRYQIQLNYVPNSAEKPLTQVATFYSNFSAQTNTLYTWNQDLPLDREVFVANELGMYFGFGSEVADISERNPNLNFDIAVMPQGAEATTKRTYGRFYGLFIATNARNKSGAYKVIGDLSAPTSAKKIADMNGMAPVHRSSLAVGTESEYGDLLYSSALFARGWYNPEITRTREILSVMIDDVNKNRTNVSNAVSDTLERLEQAYR